MTIAKIQSKLVAAQNCHPNAVQALIAEALDAIDEMARADAPAGLQPAAILPAFIGPPKRKLDELLARGFQVNGLQIERDVDGAEPVRGFITVGGLVGWWNPDTQGERDRLSEQVETTLTMVEQSNKISAELLRERDDLRAQVGVLTRDTERQASKIDELAAELVDREARHRADKARLQTIQEHRLKECWYWQGDGQDHLDSLVGSLPVVIRADQLRELLAAPATTRPAVAESYDLIDRFLRNNLGDDDYAEYSRALDDVLAAAPKVDMMAIANALADEHAKRSPLEGAGQVSIPVEPTEALLRPFLGCPEDEMLLAWQAMVQVARASQRGGA